MTLRSELIEVAARAMCLAEGDDPNREGPWEEWYPSSAYKISATAALDAILDRLGEPDEAMSCAGFDAAADHASSMGRESSYVADIEIGFQAMIATVRGDS